MSPSDSSTPSLPPRYPSSSSASPPDHSAAGRSRFCGQRVAASNLKDDFSREGPRLRKQRLGGNAKSNRSQMEVSPKSSPLSAEEVRRKRDAERVDLRRMIAAKRSEKEELLRQRAKERAEKSAARAQRTDEVHASRAEEVKVQTTAGAGGDGLGRVGRRSTEEDYLFYGGAGEVSDVCSEAHPMEEEREVAASVSVPACVPGGVLGSTIPGKGSVDLLYAPQREDSGQSAGPAIPDYVSAEALQACAPQLPPRSALSRSSSDNVPNPKEVRFRDFLGREYTPVSSGRGNARDLSAHAASMSRARESNMRYSQDDIDVDRRRASIDTHTDKELSSSCSLDLSSLVKRSSSSVPPVPETGADQEQHSDDDACVGSVHDDEDFGSMLLAMEGALCLQERPLGVDEVDDVFEEASDSDGYNDDDLEEYSETRCRHSTDSEGGADDLQTPEAPSRWEKGAVASIQDHATAGEDWGEMEGESLGLSWGSDSDEEGRVGAKGEGGGQEMTVYGVPFPLGRTIRKDGGMEFSEHDSPAVKMEALREYLEGSLGLDSFIKAYRLLKAIGPRDDDDSLLTKMEHIVGVEGLQYMNTFIQLISIEERFEAH